METNTNEKVLDKLKSLVSDDTVIIWIEPKTGHNGNYNTILNNGKKNPSFYWIKDKDNRDASSFLKGFDGIELSEAKIFLNKGVIHLLQIDNQVKIHEFYEDDKTCGEETTAYIKETKSRNSKKFPVKLITYYDEQSNPIMFRILPKEN